MERGTLERQVETPVALGEPWTREIVPGVFRIGTTYVGCYAVEDRKAYTFVDSGLPGYWKQMLGFLASRGAPLSAVEAVVLTHYHVDHRGNAERLRNEAGARVLVHRDDLAAALGGKDAFPRWPFWEPRVLRYFLHSAGSGAIRVPPVVEASSFMDEEVLDVPGRPRVVHTPGHTAGNAAISLQDRDVLIVGDALATIDFVSGESGPRLLPSFMNDDYERALASLQKIEPLRASWVLPGHGLPWEGSPRQATRLAREVAATATPTHRRIRPLRCRCPSCRSSSSWEASASGASRTGDC
jgi:glyoxylase-like metal-dependent hydrolase (beta-lactamase superfamily II)